MASAIRFTISPSALTPTRTHRSASTLRRNSNWSCFTASSLPGTVALRRDQGIGGRCRRRRRVAPRHREEGQQGEQSPRGDRCHLAERELGCLRSKHPRRDLQPLAGGVEDRHRTIRYSRGTGHAEFPPVKRVKRVVDPYRRTYGILPEGALTPTSTRWSPSGSSATTAATSPWTTSVSPASRSSSESGSSR